MQQVNELATCKRSTKDRERGLKNNNGR